MGGFDNGSLQGGVSFQAKQFGSILRGFGPPVPGAGLVGDLFIDTQTWYLYEKRSTGAGGDVDPWGHYLFQVPLAYQNALKWFSPRLPTDDIGVPGDYSLLWAGYGNYGLQPLIYGPRSAAGWVESGEGPTLALDPTFLSMALSVGVADEGTPQTYSVTTSLIAVGVAEEYVQSTVTIAANPPVYQLGVLQGPAAVAVTLNPLYTAEDAHTL